MFGQYDIVALIEAKDIDGLIRIVGNDIATADHVMRTETQGRVHTIGGF